MKIFLAGGVSGNLNPAWRRLAEEDDLQLFLAGSISRVWLFDKLQELIDARVYLTEEIKIHRPYILESYFYMNPYMEKLIPYFGDFLLDSGAFTFMGGEKSEIDWVGYIEKYADFIKKNKIKKYFELDIDNVVGYEKVKELRRHLERLTGTPCMPVWHKERGVDEWKGLTKDYDYVAIGGIIKSIYTKIEPKFFTPLINIAHSNGCKVHGLGYTSLSGIVKHHFDSVDSTAWTTGNRFGFVYEFNGKTMVKHDVPKDMRLKDGRKIALINYTEWLKFQKYAETHL